MRGPVDSLDLPTSGTARGAIAAIGKRSKLRRAMLNCAPGRSRGTSLTRVRRVDPIEQVHLRHRHHERTGSANETRLVDRRPTAGPRQTRPIRGGTVIAHTALVHSTRPADVAVPSRRIVFDGCGTVRHARVLLSYTQLLLK